MSVVKKNWGYEEVISITEVKSFGLCFLSDKVGEFQRSPRLDLVVQLDLVMCKIHPGGTGFKCMKLSCWTAEAWHHWASIREAMGQAYFQQKNPAYWRCMFHGMSSKKSKNVTWSQWDLRVVQRADTENWPNLLGGAEKIMCGSQILTLSWRHQDFEMLEGGIPAQGNVFKE